MANTSYEYRQQKYGEKGFEAIKYWNTTAREGTGVTAVMAKALANHFYRSGVCDEWIEKPEEALLWCSREYNRLGYKSKRVSLMRAKTNEKLGPSNLVIVPKGD